MTNKSISKLIFLLTVSFSSLIYSDAQPEVKPEPKSELVQEFENLLETTKNNDFSDYSFIEKMVVKLNLNKGLLNIGKIAKFRTVTKQNSPKLYNIIDDLANVFKVKIPNKIIICTGDDGYVTFSGKMLFIGKGLICDLNEAEFKAIMAHEMAHIKCKHLTLMHEWNIHAKILPFTILISYGDYILYKKINKTSLKICFFVAHSILLHSIRTLLYKLFSNPISKADEKEADLISVKITGDPKSLINALCKMDGIDPEKEDISKISCEQTFWEELNDTHPTLQQRIKYLTEASQQQVAT